MSVRISGENYRRVLNASVLQARRSDGDIIHKEIYKRARTQAVLYPGSFESRRALLAENSTLTRNGDNDAGLRGKIDPDSLPSVTLLEVFDREGINIGSIGNVDLTRPAITFEALPPAGRRELFRRLDDSNRGFLVLDLENGSQNGSSSLVKALDDPKDQGDSDLLTLARLLSGNELLGIPFVRALERPEQDLLIPLLEEVNFSLVTHDINPYLSPSSCSGWLPRYCLHFEDVRFVGIRHSARNQLLRIARRLDTVDPPADLAARFRLRVIDNAASTGVLFAHGHAEGHKLSLEVRYNPNGESGPEIVFMKGQETLMGTAYALTGDIAEFVG